MAFDPNEDIEITVTIANGQTVSDAADPTTFGGVYPVAIKVPSAVSGTALSLQTEVDGDYQDYAPGGVVQTFTMAASRPIFLLTQNKLDLQGRKIKLVSGSTEGGARTFIVIYRYIP